MWVHRYPNFEPFAHISSKWPRWTVHIPPLLSSSGPPLLPGLIEASVWMMPSQEASGIREAIYRKKRLKTTICCRRCPEKCQERNTLTCWFQRYFSDVQGCCLFANYVFITNLCNYTSKLACVEKHSAVPNYAWNWRRPKNTDYEPWSALQACCRRQK